MAIFGWKNQSSLMMRQSGLRMVDGEVSNGNGKANCDREGQQSKQTFVEVVNKHQDRSNEGCLKTGWEEEKLNSLQHLDNVDSVARKVASNLVPIVLDQVNNALGK
ncbi:hypothetical protein Q3G72_034857 [Acer saccharum]|nr:hypothetical protein Q3G72_034857 [Acer saccharum]